MPWYAVYTHPRNERKVASRLEQQEVEVYCPLQEEVHEWSDRKKKLNVPLFRSYVFVHLQDYRTQCVPILQTPGVKRFLWWLGKPALVRDQEIEAIRRFLDEYRGLPMEVQYQPGDRVEITAGPLLRQQGIIVQLDKTKVVLRLDSMRIQVLAKLPLNKVHPVS